jgi:CubicO group peptidase (beta-lactamase class C family)
LHKIHANTSILIKVRIFEEFLMHLNPFFLLLVLALSASAQSAGPGNAVSTTPPPDAAERVKEIFAAYDHPDTPGCVVGVSLGGAEVLRGAWGMADLEHRVPLTPDSVSEAGSVSKQFTAAAVLLLAEQGKLSLSDSVRKYIPELPDYGTDITIDHLLHHTSGLRDWGSVAETGGWPRTTREYSNAWVVDISSRQKALNYKPGDDWSYTNTGYNLLAVVVQRVSGKSLAQFAHDNIFLPLGMQTTTWRDDFQRIVPNRAIAYDRKDGNEHQLMPFENAYGNGGLLTTVDDLLLWNDRFSASKIGDPSFVKRELEQGKLNDGRTTFYAAGLFLTEHDGTREISHSGSTAGYRAWLGFYPERKLSVALLCNAAEANTVMLGHQVADVYLLGPGEKPAEPAHITLAASLEGLYEDLRDHTTLSIERKEGELIADGRLTLIPVSAASFQLTPEGNTYEIATDGAGKPVRLRVKAYGLELETFARVERAKPSEAEMQRLTGDYVSDEAEAAFRIVLGAKGLEIHQKPDIVYPLKPTYAGGYSSALGSVRFLRDESGNFTSLSLGNARAWDLRFRRVKAKP